MSFFDYMQWDGPDFDGARNHFVGLLEDIYKTGSITDLEFHLDELCAFFDMGMPKGDPALQKIPTKKEDETNRMLQSWMGIARAHAEMACGSTRKEN